MKKSAIIFATTLIVLLLVGKATFADENGRGNEKKNENGAQVTTEGEFKIVENKNKIMIKIKIDNKDNNGKSDEDNDDHKNEHGRDVDEDDDDDDNVAVSPSPTPETTITPTVTPTENPTITPTETPTVTPTGIQQQVFINAKIKGIFDTDQIVKFFEDLINTIKSALTPTG